MAKRLFDHVVVLMLENRSFDHVFGYLGVGEGLSGVNATNYRKPNDPKTTALICDVAATTQRLIKGRHTQSQRNQYAVVRQDNSPRRHTRRPGDDERFRRFL